MRRREPLPEPELDAELVADVRAARAVPDAVFLAALDARVHAGFPSDEPARRRRRVPDLRALAPVGGLALAVTLVAVVVLSRGDGGSQSMSSSAPALPASSASSAKSSASSAKQETVSAAAGSAATSPAAPVPSAAAPGPVAPRVRRVQRAASLTLTPARRDVQATADGVVRETQAVGGYVQRSEVSTSGSGGTASFTLRIPSARLDDALARLSKLAHVGALTQQSTDITGSFDAATARLADARAERRALLRALGRATTARQVASLRARLADNRAEVASRSAAVEGVRRRATLATVALDVRGTGRAAAAAGGDDGSWTPGDALHDAGRVLEIAAGIALVAGAVLVPLALLGALALPAARTLRRRRREAVLDQGAGGAL